MEFLSSSQLYAKQAIAGETRKEKCKEIGRIVKLIVGAINEGSEFTRDIKTQNVPNALVPLIKVLVGVKIKSHAFITEALKSNDSYVMVEALRAKWYFNGSDKSITNYNFFSTNIFPFVSMSTRREIIKRLAVGLANKKEALAEDFFSGLTSSYGVKEAIRLLPACRSDYIYEAIVKNKIVLSNKILKILYFKYPDVALRYLKFTNPYEKKDEITRTMYRAIQPQHYQNFIPHLIKNHPKVFVDLQEVNHISESLGVKRSKIFLKNAKQIIIERPRDIIDLMPIKLVYDSLTKAEFETMFGNILETRWDMFNLDEMILFLEYYPEKEKVNLIRNKVKEKYGCDLYEKVEKLSRKFLLLLPKEDRYDLARRILRSRRVNDVMDEENSWLCFLPVEEAIPALKNQIHKSWQTSKKRKIFGQLIYVCKLNEDQEALLEVLRYVDQNHKSEKADVICNMLDLIVQEFDIDKFDKEYWELLFNIIKRIKLKKENAREYWMLIKVLKKNVHYCERNNLPSNEIIDLIVQLFEEGRVGVSWKLLEDDMAFERRYLDVTFKRDYWLDISYKKNAIEGIYSFNERYQLEDSDQKLSIKDYPHLLAKVEEIMKEKDNEQIWLKYAKKMLIKHEPELCSSWFSGEKFLDSDSDNNSESYCCDCKEPDRKSPEVKEKVIYLTEAIIALKRNYKEIKDNWKRYYECCKNEMETKKKRRVKLFLKALRWYQDVPIQFVKFSIEEKNFSIMAYLLEGETFSKIAATYLPKEDEENHCTSYIHALHITMAVKNTTTPIPIDLVERYMNSRYMYSFKNYINDGIKLWSYVAYRTSTDKVAILSRNLSKDSLFMKRHSIRLMNQIASRSELVNFYSEMRQKETHPMIREMLTGMIGKLFERIPSQDTWQLMSACLADLSSTEGEILEELIGFLPVPPEFASVYADQVLKIVHEFTDKGNPWDDSIKYLLRLFENIKPECKDHLSEDFYKNSIQFYLERPCEYNKADRFIVKVYLNPSSVHFEERLKHMTQLLKEQSKKWYSMSMEKRKNSSNFIDNFVQAVVSEVQKFKGTLRLVENLYNIFSTNFTPYQHAWAHIMLFLCTEFLRVEQSFKDFGKQLSLKIDSLVKKFTPEYLMQIVEHIRVFICNFNSYEYYMTVKNRLNFLEGLIENKNTYGLIIAAKLLHQKTVSEYDNQHYSILEQLSKVDNPIVQSLL